MGIDGPIGGADRTQAEIIRPARQLPIEPTHHHLGIQKGTAKICIFTDGGHDPLDAFLRAPGANIGSPRDLSLASPKGVHNAYRITLKGESMRKRRAATTA